ncbi:MAG: response regulator [Gammaproteobacteria bacterium]|nr:response regulator [Gammaproteobacteria bacterium]
MREAQDHSALKWVREELEKLIEQARHALETYVDVPDDRQSIEQCITALHQTRGTLQMMQLEGAVMLAEEMERVAVAMRDNTTKRASESAEALMLGMVQLPEYLEKLEGGARDIPLLMMPMLNELRATRGEAQLSELALFAPGLDERLASEKVQGKANPALETLARRNRFRYHSSLLEWYQGNDVNGGLLGIGELLQDLELASGTLQLKRLFRVGRAAIELLRESGVKPGVAAKELFGRLDREIKRIIDCGEQEVAQKPPNDLLKDFLFFVVYDESGNPLIEEVKREFGLENTILSKTEIDRERQGLHAPGRDLMQSVKGAIGPELTAIKDGVDLYIRDGTSDTKRLDVLEQPMRRIADTLGMIGQGALRERLTRQADSIAEYRGSGEPPDEQALMAMAGDILYIETSLENLASSRHQSLMLDSSSLMLDSEESGAAQLPQGEFARLVDMVMREAEVDMARNKDAIVSFIETPTDKSLLAEVPKRFISIAGAFKIMELSHAAGLLEGLSAYVESSFLSSDMPETEDLNLFADALTAVEYYMQAISEGRGIQEEVLLVAEEALSQLMGEPLEIPPVEVLGPVNQVPESPDQTAVSVDESPEPLEQPEVITGSDEESAGEEIDDEILEIFIEEARSEIESIDENLLRWVMNQDDREAMATLRRSFHTLKGSGRLVGALTIGEFCWSIENLLNRVIDGTASVSPEMLELLEQTRKALPGLVDAQEAGRSHDVDLNPLMEKAFALSVQETPSSTMGAGDGEDIPETEPEAAEDTRSAGSSSPGDVVVPFPGRIDAVEVPDVPGFDPAAPDVGSEPDLPPPIELDAELLSIFDKETKGHLDTLRRFLDECRRNPDSCDIGTSDVERALHTLHGSADMAGVEAIAEISGGLESWVKEMKPVTTAVDERVLDLVDRCTVSMAAVLGVINVPGGELPDWQALTVEIEQARDSLSQEQEVQEIQKVQEQQLEATGASVSHDKQPEPLSTVAGSAYEFENLDGDAELTEIFLEEAKELLESVEGSLSHWEQEPDSAEPVADLKRTLHTLKGGSRLAGAMPVGELSHTFESLLSEIDQARMTATPEVLGLSREVTDRLAEQIEDIEQSPRVRKCDDLIVRLERLIAGEKEPPKAEKQEVPDVAESDLDVQQDQVAETGAEGDTVAEKGAVEAATAKDAADKPKKKKSEQIEQWQSPAATLEHKQPASTAPEPRSTRALRSRDIIRVPADDLDRLVNNAGEVSIFRARLEQQNTALGFNLSELEQTVVRLRAQLRKLEIETETQILFRYERDKQEDRLEEAFDPLELDRFSNMQQLSRGLLETVNDLANINGFLDELRKETDTLLLQQSRVSTDLQDGLLRTRMVPFAQLVPRLQRVVRQTAATLGKKVDMQVNRAEGELDRGILDRIIGPLEHILRNAVSHGIEMPKERKSAGKKETGRILLDLNREGNDVILTISDDGKGINIESIRKHAIKMGLLDPKADVPESDILQFVLEHGFSTQQEVNQISGRGVGLDVVVKEVKQLGGALEIKSSLGQGTGFILRLPLTLAITDALVVEMGDEIYAIPHSSIEGVVRLSRKQLLDSYEGRMDRYNYAEHDYQVRYLGGLLNASPPSLPDSRKWFPLLLVRAGEHRVALQVDNILGNRQIVVKSVGPQISTVRWISGGTILADGRVALILDVTALVRMDAAQKVLTRAEDAGQPGQAAEEKLVMVVDDSITVRKVTGRILERHGMRVVTAKDGVDAVTALQEYHPDLMLLDIEMPRMDGYELARHMRHTRELEDIPIIMITSRTGEKHRRLAMEVGVTRYLGKPYQEIELLENINDVLSGADE